MQNYGKQRLYALFASSINSHNTIIFKVTLTIYFMVQHTCTKLVTNARKFEETTPKILNKFNTMPKENHVEQYTWHGGILKHILGYNIFQVVSHTSAPIVLNAHIVPTWRFFITLCKSSMSLTYTQLKMDQNPILKYNFLGL